MMDLRIAALGGALALLACAPSGRAPVVEMAPAPAAIEALAPVAEVPPQVVPLHLAFPQDGEIFSQEPEVYVAGKLDLPFAETQQVDAILVIDTSQSTSANTNARATDPAVRAMRGPHRRGEFVASVLEVELASALRLLKKTEPDLTRLGVVTFAGSSRTPGANAKTVVPLSREMLPVAEGLQQIGRRPASGKTDMAAGLDQAIDELIGRGRSRPDPQARKVVVFFTDGKPTLPHRSVEDNEQAVIRAAERAAAHGVRIFSFAVGPEAVDRPLAPVEMARRTGGVFTPVRKPSELTAAVEAVQLTDFDEIEIRNLDAGTGANRLDVGRDGTFEALVPLANGKNRIVIQTRVGNVYGEARRIVHYAPGEARAFDPARLEATNRMRRRMDREVEVGVARTRQQRRVDVYIGERREPDAKSETDELLEALGFGPDVDVAAPPPADHPAP